MIKRFIALTVSALLALSLFACGNKNDDSASGGGGGIVGTWVFAIDINDVVNVMDEITSGMDAEELAMFGPGIHDFHSSIKINVYFTFSENGTFTISVNQREVENSFRSWVDDIMGFMINLMTTYTMPNMAREQGMTYADLSAAFHMMMGQSIDQFIKESVDEMMATEMEWMMADLMSELAISQTGRYKTEGDRLYSVEEGQGFNESYYETFEIRGNTLRFTSTTNPDFDDLGGVLSFPFTLTRR
jgi:hypothetical protein